MSDEENVCTCGDPENGWGVCEIHVSCDENCKALNDPKTMEEINAAYEHYKSHPLAGGCSHGGR